MLNNLNVDRKIVKIDIERLGPSVITLSKYEDLYGHANSVKLRIKKGLKFD